MEYYGNFVSKYLLHYFSSHLCHCSDVAMWRSDFALAVVAVLTSAAKRLFVWIFAFQNISCLPNQPQHYLQYHHCHHPQHCHHRHDDYIIGHLEWFEGLGR